MFDAYSAAERPSPLGRLTGSSPASAASARAALGELLYLLLRQMLDADEGVAPGDHTYEFVELRLDGRAIAVLCVLTQKSQ
jgi:hypothetical protein